MAQTRPRSNKALDLHQATQSPAAFSFSFLSFLSFFFHFSPGPYFWGSAPTPQALQLSQVWHSLQKQPGTPLSITSALCSPGLRSRDRNPKPRFGTPSGQYSPDRGALPSSGHMLKASVPTLWPTLPRPPPARPAGQPELGLLGTPSRPDATRGSSGQDLCSSRLTTDTFLSATTTRLGPTGRRHP